MKNREPILDLRRTTDRIVALAVVFIVTLAWAMGAFGAQPYDITRSGYYELKCDGVAQPRSTTELEALEKAGIYAGNGHPRADCQITPPSSRVVYSLVQPPETTQPPTSPPTATLPAFTYSASQAGSYAVLDGVTITAGQYYVLLGAQCGTGPWSFAVDGTAVNSESSCPFGVGPQGDGGPADFGRLAAGAHTLSCVPTSACTSARFTITSPPTQPPTSGAATVTWTAPTSNTDGTAIAGPVTYRIVYGTSADALTREQVASASPATVPDLAAGTWYFAVRAVNAAGVLSANSNVASKVIQ